MNPLTFLGLAISLVVAALSAQKPAQFQATPKNTTQPPAQISYSVRPIQKAGSTKPNIAASSALAYDIDSGVMLLQKDIDSKRPIASINKLMTALVIMEGHKPNEVVTVKDLPELGLYDQKIGIKNGEEFELIELLKATLIQSANDAANALAIHDSGSIDNFSRKMNQKAKDWGLENSKYSNANGLEGGDDYSSAHDVLTLANLLYTNKTFEQIVATRSDTITNLSGKSYPITTTNKILGQNGISGIKTGYTLKAGECLVTVTKRNGHSVITVVLDSPDRFQESKNMIDWSFNNYIWQ